MLETKICPYCGNQVRADAVFCLDCGKRIIGRENVQAKEATDDTGEINPEIEPKPIEVTESDKVSEAVAESQATAYFKIDEGVDKGLTVPLGDKVIIGRAKKEGCFTLNDPYVSREHLVIKQVGDRFILKHLSKTNESIVNNQPITEHILEPGDVVEIGYTIMTFHRKLD